MNTHQAKKLLVQLTRIADILEKMEVRYAVQAS